MPEIACFRGENGRITKACNTCRESTIAVKGLSPKYSSIEEEAEKININQQGGEREECIHLMHDIGLTEEVEILI